MSVRFCLIFPYPLTEVHLSKETGKIPEVVGRQLGWTAEIVYCGGESPDKLRDQRERETPHVRLIGVKGSGNGSLEPSLLRFLWRNSRKIDVLMLMHSGKNMVIYGNIYKMLNPAGFLWNKLDLNEGWVGSEAFLPRASWHPRRAVRVWLQNRFARIVDLISAESNGVYNIIIDRYPRLIEKTVVLHCGVDARTMPVPKYSGPRKSFILNVARLGSDQKATDFLLEAFARSKLWPAWTLVLIGPVETSFQPWLKEFVARHPEAWNCVRMVGPITSREELADWYAQSKVFCFPSRYESWGLALTEAGYYGCACVSTDFYAAVDMLDGGRYGVLTPIGSIDGIVNGLVNLCGDEKLMEYYGQSFQERVLERFTWDKVIKCWYGIVSKRREILKNVI